jgi:hypothetical protein
MNGPTILRELLLRNTALMQLVPAGNVYVGFAPLSAKKPNIAARMISSVDRKTVSMSEGERLITERVQASIKCDSYAALAKVVESVRAGTKVSRGNVGGFKVDSVIADDLPMYEFDDTESTHETSIDFIVKYVLKVT